MVLNWTIPASINYHLLLMKYIVLLIYSSSKAFDKVWHVGIIFKLTHNGMSGNLLNLLLDFLNERKQQAVLSWQFSTWQNVNAGVTQVSILRPLLFLIYINDQTEVLSSNRKLFADDTSLFSAIHMTFKLL